MTDPKGTPARPREIQPPRGTRDLYPVKAARRRWLMERWREVSIRHGFEEVDGPTYEEADLYAVKSGEGILGELFQAFSGKSPEEVEQVKQTGRAPYALRPEFTPTLARMYAAKAAGLPKPCKWFMAGPFFRAERPQRGRLREFLQWNCDFIGGDDAVEGASHYLIGDLEVISCCIDGLRAFGLSSKDVRVKINNRAATTRTLSRRGVGEADLERAFQLLDAIGKLPKLQFEERCREQVFDPAIFESFRDGNTIRADVTRAELQSRDDVAEPDVFLRLFEEMHTRGIDEWCEIDTRIVRGLAYYTGTVFEVIADGERAVAGGGRYDNLIELFGGPPTPAVGFAMGDVVLSLLLQDKDLMPSDDELMGLVGQHPDVFVLSNGADEAEAEVRSVVAMLRRARVDRLSEPIPSADQPNRPPGPPIGSESRATQPIGSEGRSTQPIGSESRSTQPIGSESRSTRTLHVRHSYKATKKPDKLLNEAKKQHAKLAVIIEDASSCSVKDLRTDEQWPDRVAIGELHARLVAAL